VLRDRPVPIFKGVSPHFYEKRSLLSSFERNPENVPLFPYKIHTLALIFN